MSNETAPEFTRRQMEWLEKMFPEVAGTPTTTNEALRFHAGQRSVIHVVRQRVQKN